jgi:hypothetical protein
MRTNAEQGKGGYDVISIQASNVLSKKKSPIKATGTSLITSSTKNYSINEQAYIINIINGLVRQQ